MAVEEFLAAANATAQSSTPETPQASQQNSVMQARTEATYNNAGQAPPTPSTYAGILPHVKGGFAVWIVIVLLLWAAFGFYNAAHHGLTATLKIEATA